MQSPAIRRAAKKSPNMKSDSEESKPVLLREEVTQLQEEVHLLRQMKEMLTKDLEETHGSKSTEVLSATELKLQLAQKEQELARAKEALQGNNGIKLATTATGFQLTMLVREFNLENYITNPFKFPLEGGNELAHGFAFVSW
ncbi:hypothetical protein KIL84_022313 [Mauremys mutica]|uniref:Kazrin N-terminal domain-containing protein n=1 Tax=Mauremys mutica TaxID=74926 RepID=A0A9D3XA18_9SAUR|nr:hypothetical protein KIL84_022313 [Mauremys mutica]